MANRQTAGYGFRSAGTLGNTPATQGLSKYFIDAALNADHFYGQAVAVTAGYIVTAEDAATAESVGVMYGIFYEDASTLKQRSTIIITVLLHQQQQKTVAIS
jgi:hypothetical protein